MSSQDINYLCRDLASTEMDGLCKTRNALQRQVDKLADAGVIIAASNEVLQRVSDPSAIAVYSIRGEVDQLMRVLIAASGVRGPQAGIIIVVDDEHYEATVETFKKNFGDRHSKVMENEIDFGSFVVTRGSPGTKEPFAPNDEEAAQGLSNAAARVVNVSLISP